ncbi:hypothetical protein C0992_009688 [Termitomyces sp. T32_za158]|nr:hypothetical protein C0992_009688 [Termitomyces sp. T32_za158]
MRKNAVYAYAQPQKSKPKMTFSSLKQKHGLSPMLVYELVLMQFSDSGSTKENIKRLMESHACAAAPAGTKAVAVNDIYHDSKGGVWLDRKQEMEYVHLLGRHDTLQEKWVLFGSKVKTEDNNNNDNEHGLAIMSLPVNGRRGSAMSDASMDLGNLIKPTEGDVM